MKLELKIHTYKKVLQKFPPPRKFHARIESKILSSLIAREAKEDGTERKGRKRGREGGKNGLTSHVLKQSQGLENQVTKIETRLGDPCRGRKSRKQEVHLISRR